MAFLFILLTTFLMNFLILFFLPAHLTEGPRSKFTFLLTSSSALGITLLLCYLWIRKFKNALSEIEHLATRLSKGNFEGRLPLNVREEAGKLAHSIDQMAASIEKQVFQLSEDRTHLSALLTGMVEGVLVLDRQGQILLTNTAMEKMFGLSGQEIKGPPFIEVIRHHRLNEFIQSTLESKTNPSEEITISTPEEKIFFVQASTAKGTDEQDIAAAFVFHDVTPLKVLERVRKDFVANVSHELRTPLASIKGYIEALLDGAKENPKQCGEFLKIIEKHADRLNNILSDLLALSQIESGKYRWVRDEIQVLELFEKVSSLLKPLAKKKDQHLTINIPQPVNPIQGDLEKMTLVVTNLLDNAVKYTPHGGKITISALETDQVTEISVTDTGSGIPKKDLARIFERFYRVDRTRSREMGGTGLGLSIVKHIVEAHGGSIMVHSQPEQGSTFTIRIPKRKGNAWS